MARSQIAKQLQNERRKIARRIKSLQQAAKETQSTTVASTIQEEIRMLQKAKRASKLRTKSGRVIKSHNTEEYKQNALRTLQELNDKYGSYVRSMRSQNAITQTEINIASVGGESTYTREEVKAFYHATEKIWNAKSQTGESIVGEHNRNEAIMKAYGVRSLSEVFKIVLDEVKLDAKIAQGLVSEEDVAVAKEIIRNRRQYTEAELEWAWDALDVNDVSEGIASPTADTTATPSSYIPVGAR